MCAMEFGVAWHECGDGYGNERRGGSAIVSLSLAAAGGGGEHTSSRDTALKVHGPQIHPWTLPKKAAIELPAGLNLLAASLAL